MSDDANSVEDELRATRPIHEPTNTLFHVEEDWRSEWWGMPSYEMNDARPRRRIAVNFMTDEDVLEFSRVTGLRFGPNTDSLWFPPQERLRGEFYYTGPKTDSRYPVCIPSKGRWDVQTTGKLLEELGVTYRFFVEETEGDQYIERLGSERVVVMPFHDLGRGSIPARNFIWDWARERECARHWVLDDNIGTFTRMSVNRRLRVRGGGYFRAIEDWVDRYENIALAGPHDQGFVPDRESRPPFHLNTRVYSCILIDTSLPHRWRGRYNEDTDLSLRVLKDGYCTVVFRALCMNKLATAGSAGKPLKGGNTDHVYNTGDHRRAFAESLRLQHPDVVKVTWKFGRWHHDVDYEPFRSNRLRLRSEVVPTRSVDDYGMVLKRRPV